jgi:hypothetical protein
MSDQFSVRTSQRIANFATSKFPTSWDGWSGIGPKSAQGLTKAGVQSPDDLLQGFLKARPTITAVAFLHVCLG